MAGSSLQYALKIMDCLAQSENSLGFNDLQRSLGGISPTTVSRVMRNLVEAGVVCKLENGRYSLDERISFWGLRARQTLYTNRGLHDDLKQLSTTFRVTTTYRMRMDNSICIVDRCLDPHSPSLGEPGRIYPVILPVSGAVFCRPLDQWTSEQITKDIAEYANASQCDVIAARDMIEKAFANKLMDDQGMLIPGVRRLDVSLDDKVPACGIVTVGCVPQRLEDDSLRREIITALHEMVQRHMGRTS